MGDLELPTRDQARNLTDRIKVAVEGTWLLIQEAYTSRSWSALGYSTWDAYCTAEFGETRLRLPREERQEIVASMRDSGMSLRAISSATGISPATAMRDTRVSDETPVEVIGTKLIQDADLLAGDGWQQPAGPGFEAAVTAPSRAKRRPLPEAFTDAGRDLTRAAERLARLTDDDRFAKNRETTHRQLPELLAALDNTTRLLNAMNLAAADASEEARRWWATSLRNVSDALTGIASSLEQENRNA